MYLIIVCCCWWSFFRVDIRLNFWAVSTGASAGSGVSGDFRIIFWGISSAVASFRAVSTGGGGVGCSLKVVASAPVVVPSLRNLTFVTLINSLTTSNSLPVFGRAAGGEGSWCHRRHGVEAGGGVVQVEAGRVVRVRGGGGEVRVEGGVVVQVKRHNGSA